MNLKDPFLACLVVPLLPGPSLACGGCTDAVLLMTLPRAGFGILLLWLWLLTMFATRWRLRRGDSRNAASVVRGRTLAVFAALGSVGYIGLTFLTGGSLLLPSLVIGFAWVVYLAIRVVVNVVRFVCKRDSGSRMPLVIHSAFLMLIIVLIAYYQTKANTRDHCIGCLRFGHHTQLFSKIMPRIVADG